MTKHRISGILTFVIATIVFQSCISTQEFAAYVDQKYAQEITTPVDSSYIEYDIPRNEYVDDYTKTERLIPNTSIKQPKQFS